jgi:hypothetical protein
MVHPWPSRQKRLAFRPAVEALEARCTPAAAFAGAQTFATHNAPDAVAVADFNGDGKPDFAAAGINIAVFLNTTPTGSPTPAFATPQTFAGAGSLVAVADFNGDGKPDLAVNVNGNALGVLLNTTAAGSATVSFAAPQTFAGIGPMVVGDFNDDGKPDLAVNVNGTVSVFLNSTPAGSATVSFAAPQTFAGGGSGPLAVGDLNGDGKLDLVGINAGTYQEPATTVLVLLNTTATRSNTATFAAPQTIDVGVVPAAVAVGDFNDDGWPDLAVVGQGGAAVLLNTRSRVAGTVVLTAAQTFAAGQSPDGVAVGDFNGDGRPDLAVTNGLSGTVSLLLDATLAGATTASFTGQQTFSTAGDLPSALALADFNGDSKPDVVATNFNSSSASVILNATFAPVVGQFGGQGVWQYDSATGAWSELTAANASVLATDILGDVVGEFPGAGVWEYTPGSGWKQINGVDATALVVNANGTIAAAFPGFGVGLYRPSVGWSLLTGARASILGVEGQDNVVGEFPGFGVWLFRPANGWQQINGVDASLLVMNPSGDIAANFPGFGVGLRASAGVGIWTLINGVQATALSMDAFGNIAATFPGYGVGQYQPGTGWTSLTGANAGMLAAADGIVAGAFSGYGVWEFDPTRGWFQLTAANATFLAAVEGFIPNPTFAPGGRLFG